MTSAGISEKSSFHNKRAYLECAGRGTCDRTTGECACYDGYTGKGCERNGCPNSCSGHGRCLNDWYAHYKSGANALASQEDAGFASYNTIWAAQKFSQCICDPGFEGADCSQRMCPKGDDPETDCEEGSDTFDTQKIVCDVKKADGSFVTDTFSSAYIALTFTNFYGAKYISRPIDIANTTHVDTHSSRATNAFNMQQGLEALPNFAIPSVQVNFQTENIKHRRTFIVSFNDAANTGKQAVLEVSGVSKCADGSLPKIPVPTGGSAASVDCVVSRLSVNPLSGNQIQYLESAECSNRGTCNRKKGSCSCFAGYGGPSCSEKVAAS